MALTKNNTTGAKSRLNNNILLQGIRVLHIYYMYGLTIVFKKMIIYLLGAGHVVLLISLPGSSPSVGGCFIMEGYKSVPVITLYYALSLLIQCSITYDICVSQVRY